MSNRPLKNKKKVVLEEEDHEVEYRPPGRTSRDVIVQLGVTFLIVSFILAPMLVFVFSDRSTPAQQQQAQQQQDPKNDIEGQIKQYSTELSKNPGDPATLANLAYYTTQKAGMLPETDNQRMTLLKEAEGNFRKALEKDANYGFAQAELAKNLAIQKNYDEANKLIEQAMKSADADLTSSDPAKAADAKARKVEMLRVSAIILIEKKDMKGGLEKFSEAIAVDPGNPQLYKQRAFLYMQNNDKESARKDLTTMVDIGQKSGDQNAAMEGQMYLQSLDQPIPTPGATSAPVVNITPGAQGTPTTVVIPPTPAAPGTPATAPSAPATP